MSLGWLLAYGAVWSLFTAISVYVVSAEAGRSHVEHAVVVGGFLILAAGSRAVVGPHAARAAAYAFAPMALFFFGSSREVQNELLVGMGEWCGTGRYSAAMLWAMLALPMGALTVALFLLFQRIAVRASVAVPSREFVLQALGAGLFGLSVVGALTAAARPTPQAFLAAVERVETLSVSPPATHALTNESGHDLRVACGSGSDMLPFRSTACRLYLGHGDDASGTRVSTSPVIVGDEKVVISRHPTEPLWVFELQKGSDRAQPFAVEFDGHVREALHVEDVQGRFGPSLFVVGLAWVSALVLGGFAHRWSRVRARIAKVLEGREGVVDADGHVVVDGVQHLLDPGLAFDREDGPVPVIVLSTQDREGYRDVKTVTSIVRGTKRGFVERLAAERREWRAVALLTATLLVMPMIASAALGLL